MIDDPFDLLRAHLRGQADTIESTTSIDELIAHIVFEHDRVPAVARSASGHPGSGWRTPTAARPPRRWGSAVVGLALCVGIATGAVVTAAVLDRARVERPDAGVVCRVSTDDQMSAYVLPLTDDPIGACADLWRRGILPDPEHVSPGTYPPLVACTGPRGALEIYPGEGDQVCTSIGLSPADIDAMMDDPLTELGRRVAAINEQCLPPADARLAAIQLLDDPNFEGWHVLVSAGQGCSVVSVDVEHSTLRIAAYPPSG